MAALPVVGLASPAQAAAPTISTLSPTVGDPGATVTITGSGFATTPASNTVTFGTVRAQVSTATATRLTVVAPSVRASGKVRVRTAGGTSNTRDFFVPPAPHDASAVSFTGRTAANGTPVTVPVTATRRVGILMVDGQAGQRFHTQISGGTAPGLSVRLLRPDGTQLGSFSGSGAGVIDTVSLPVTGSYSLVVAATGAGNVTLRVRTVPAESTGTLVRGVAQTVTTSAIGQNATRSFSATAGQRVGVEFGATTYARVRLVFVKPDGGALGAATFARPVNDVMGEYPAGLLGPVTIPATGTYRVKIDPEGTATGSIRLTLRDVPADSVGTIASGVPQQVTTTVAGQNAVRTFSATAGQRIVFEAVDHTFEDTVHGFVMVSVLGPAGQVVLSAYTHPSFAYRSETFVLPVTGEYRFLVDPGHHSVGSLTLKVSFVPGDNTGTLTPGTPSTVTTVDGQSAERTFGGTAGQRMALTMNGQSGAMRSAVVEVFAPDGTVVMQLELNALELSMELNLPQSGTYRLTIDPLQPGPGTVVVSLRTLVEHTGALTVGGAQRTLTFAEYERANLTFQGVAGQPVTVQITASTVPSMSVRVVRPDGTDAGGAFVTTASGALAVSVPISGTYRIVVDPIDRGSGTATMRVVRA